MMVAHANKNISVYVISNICYLSDSGLFRVTLFQGCECLCRGNELIVTLGVFLNNAPRTALNARTMLSVTLAEYAERLVSGSWHVIIAVNAFLPIH